MNVALPPWVSRAAAVTLLAAVLGALYLYAAVLLIATYRNTDEEIARTRELLVRYEQIAARRHAYQAQLDELSRRQTGTGVYLSGATDALAAAELQDRVKAMVDAHGGKLRSVQILPVKADGAFTRVSVRVQLSANTAAFHRLLYGLEAGKPFVFVDNLDVRNRRAVRRSALKDLDPTLMIRFDLQGYLRPEIG